MIDLLVGRFIYLFIYFSAHGWNIELSYLLLQARSLLGALSDAIGCSNTSELFELHMTQMLASMDPSYKSWTQHSAERFVFDALVLEAGTTTVSISLMSE